ncbi:hypothetical protein BDV27DRAFT_19627 [Aspergillus caelatus]|uniref:Uncharacterized protein n=1 Tax=Aspergillus caelatus TaxID=61420 RepID=A0A5N6ZXF5_9EURO|nr:uncharacterized protein BDV27DRAFT_19627 [Aspergillus caelatus]KAE8362294.1 hypothetical protein BDV27DRAFT_19627 [Aspergillus caelatus]
MEQAGSHFGTGSITESLLAIVLLVLSYYLCNVRSRWSLTSNYLSPTCFIVPSRPMTGGLYCLRPYKQTTFVRGKPTVSGQFVDPQSDMTTNPMARSKDNGYILG